MTTGKYGPNTEEVVALIDRASRLTVDEADRLADAWDAAWCSAWDAARFAGRRAGRFAAWDAARDDAWDAAWVDAWGDARDAAQIAAADAAGALAVRDLITPEQFDALYGPWASVIGEPLARLEADET